MNLRAFVLAWMLAVVALPTFNATAGDGWFGGSSKPAANGVTTGKKSGISAWLPSWPTSKPKAKSTKPSAMSNMAKGTKSAWSKTVSFMNPFDNPPKPASSDSSANSSSWWGSPKAKPTEPATVNDWLGGKKPSW